MAEQEKIIQKSGNEMDNFARLQEAKNKASQDQAYNQATARGVGNVRQSDYDTPDAVADIKGRGLLGEKLKKLTASMLQEGWELMAVSFGLSIVLVDLVILMSYIIGEDKICQLGYEWVPPEVAKADPAKAKQIGENLQIVEKMGCGCINLIWLMIILAIILFIAIIVNSYLFKSAAWIAGLFS